MDYEAFKSICRICTLTDDLLVEILCRLPCAEKVVQCKCVSKKWFNVISQPEFPAQFIAHKVNMHVLKVKGMLKCEMLPSEYHVIVINENGLIYPSTPAFTVIDSSLSFIPSYKKEKAECPIRVHSWCSDLILCSSSQSGNLVFYICNPRTKQWFELPAQSCKSSYFLAGFTHDPYYKFNEETATVTVSNSRRFSVFYTYLGGPPVSEREIEIFSSETLIWKKTVLITPKSINYFFADGNSCFTYNKMLHLYTKDAIVGFDPLNISVDGVIQGHMIEMPPVGRSVMSVNVGVHDRKLLLAQYSEHAQQGWKDCILRTWELMDYDTGEWSLKSMVNLCDLVWKSLESIGPIGLGTFIICIHPDDPDVVVLMLFHQIVECNLREKSWRFIHNTTTKFEARYSLALPWWPSPLP